MRAAEKLRSQLQTRERRLLGVPDLASALAKADAFILREAALLQAYGGILAKLPTNPAPSMTASQLAETQKNFDEASHLLSQLAPDIQAEEQTKLNVLSNKWSRTLEAQADLINTSYEANLANLEKGAPKLDYAAGPELARSILKELLPALAQLRENDTLFASNLPTRIDLRQRREIVETRITAFEKEVNKLDGAADSMQTAKTFQDFALAMESLAQSEFGNSALVSAARKWRAAEFSGETFLQSMLGNNRSGLASYLKSNKGDRFVPLAAMPTEIAYLRNIQSVISTGNGMHRYRLVPPDTNAPAMDWLTVERLNSQTGWKNVLAYQPAASPASFVLKEVEYGYFDGQFRLSPREPVMSVIDLGSSMETACSSVVNCDMLLVNDNWRRPLLEVLDEVCASTNGSPLFRAYLFNQLYRIMELQPEAWGLAFCPLARAHREELTRMAGALAEGDWFAPEPRGRLTRRLEDFFQSTRTGSYYRQASGLAALIRNIWTSGVTMVGYVDLEGNLRLRATTERIELWVFVTDHKTPVLLVRSASQTIADLPRAAPLSPIYALKQNRAEFLRTAGINPADPIFASYLPALFMNANISN